MKLIVASNTVFYQPPFFSHTRYVVTGLSVMPENLICSQVTEKEIAPQLDVLVSYVCCAMTHISQPVQEDSLLLLDVLLGTCPGLVVENSDKVLPRFLDMISRLRTDARPGRTLTVNLGSRMTGVAWRIQVLTRLHDLLHAMVVHGSNGQHGTEDLLQMKTVVAHPGVNYFPIFLAKERRICFLPRVFQPSNTPENNSLGAREVLKSYIAALMPLLFETWQEIVPDDDSKNGYKYCIYNYPNYMGSYFCSGEQLYSAEPFCQFNELLILMSYHIF